MTNELTVAAFDLAWSGDVGWAVIGWAGGQFVSVRSGTFGLPRFRDEAGKARNAGRLVRAVGEVLADVSGERLVACYESSLAWLLAAARRGGRGRRPVTRDSLLASAFSVACFWVAVDEWARGRGTGAKVVAVDAQKVRVALGVETVAAMHRALTDDVAALPGYGGDRVKAAVGAAVAVRMELEGFGLAVPATDHEADALCAGFAVADAELLLMRAEGNLKISGDLPRNA